MLQVNTVVGTTLRRLAIEKGFTREVSDDWIVAVGDGVFAPPIRLQPLKTSSILMGKSKCLQKAFHVNRLDIISSLLSSSSKEPFFLKHYRFGMLSLDL